VVGASLFRVPGHQEWEALGEVLGLNRIIPSGMTVETKKKRKFLRLRGFLCYLKLEYRTTKTCMISQF
jgi:hypothetical protein